MTDLQQNRYDKLIRRVGNLQGAGSMVNDVLTELFPMIDVENVPGELLALMGTRLGFGGANISASAGEIGKIQIFNPAESALLVTITGIVLSTAVSNIMEMDTTVGAIGSVFSTRKFRDLRFGVSQTTAAEIRTLTDAGGIPGTFSARVSSDTPLQLTDPNGLFILSPGSGLTVANASVNVAITASFFWRERVAEPSELNL